MDFAIMQKGEPMKHRMSRAIDAVELKISIAYSNILEDGKSLDQIIDEQPTIEPERKGMWLHGKEVDREVCGTIAIVHYDGWKCSLCDCLVEQANAPTYKFCPNCGAMMRIDE